MLDLRLLHHYLTSARDTFPFPDDLQIARFWSVSVPRLAFEHEFLLDAVLSAAAFHLSAYLPNDDRLADAAHTYYVRAITQHREALSTINHTTADPLCVASVFIMLITFKAYCKISAHTPYSPPSQWFRIIHGMGVLIRHSDPFLTSDGIRLLMNKAHTPSGTARSFCELPKLPDLSELLSMDKIASDSDLSQEAKHSRSNFGNNVHHIFSFAVAGASRHSVRYQLLALASTNDEHFLRLIEQEDMLTIIILSHYFALLDWTGGNWWLQSDLDTELLRLFSSIPRSLQWAVASRKCVDGEDGPFFTLGAGNT